MKTLPATILPSFRPGDLLLYHRTGLIPWLIGVKTWSVYTHVETYLGDGKAHGARITGVDTYPVSFDGLLKVRRPYAVFNSLTALPYIVSVRGQHYDILGLFRFFTLGKQSTLKQFCSEDAVRLARAAGIEPFTPETDADLVSPGMLDSTPAYKTIFSAPQEA
jgi:hypothetical protein